MTAPTTPALDREAVAEAAYTAALSENGRKVGLPWDATAGSKECWLRVADAILALTQASAAKVPEGLAMLVPDDIELFRLLRAAGRSDRLKMLALNGALAPLRRALAATPSETTNDQ